MLAVDVHLHDTYFVVAHFHYVMFGGVVIAFLSRPALLVAQDDRPDVPARCLATDRLPLMVFVGFNLTFFPQFLLGYLGMPRRYHAYPDEFQVLNVMSTAGASILGIGFLIPLGYFIWSLWWGKTAPANPWRATGLEWTTPSPPPTFNFDETPIVTEEAYAYHDDPNLVETALARKPVYAKTDGED